MNSAVLVREAEENYPENARLYYHILSESGKKPSSVVRVPAGWANDTQVLMAVCKDVKKAQRTRRRYRRGRKRKFLLNVELDYLSFNRARLDQTDPVANILVRVDPVFLQLAAQDEAWSVHTEVYSLDVCACSIYIQPFARTEKHYIDAVGRKRYYQCIRSHENSRKVADDSIAIFEMIRQILADNSTSPDDRIILVNQWLSSGLVFPTNVVSRPEVVIETIRSELDYLPRYGAAFKKAMDEFWFTQGNPNHALNQVVS